MNSNFEKGEKVFDIRMGWGVVREVCKSKKFGIEVDFLMDYETYMHDGKSNADDKVSMLQREEYSFSFVGNNESKTDEC